MENHTVRHGRRHPDGRQNREDKKYVGNETFMLTYGDGVADIDIPALLECHRKSGKIATLTAVRPTSRFGTLRISVDGGISDFRENPKIPTRG